MENETDNNAPRDLFADFALRSTFIPFSQSRNRDNKKHPSLNWRILVTLKGRDVLTCDYSAGYAHAPAHNNERLKRSMGSAGLFECIKRECETGRAVKGFFVNLDHMTFFPSNIEPDKRDVLSSLFLDAGTVADSGGFADWCAELGYSADSISARAVFDTCTETFLALHSAVGPEAFRAMREALND